MNHLPPSVVEALLRFAGAVRSTPFLGLRRSVPPGGWQRTRVGIELFENLKAGEQMLMGLAGAVEHRARTGLGAVDGGRSRSLPGSVAGPLASSTFVDADPAALRALSGRCRAAAADLHQLCRSAPAEAHGDVQVLDGLAGWVQSHARRIDRVADRLADLADPAWTVKVVRSVSCEVPGANESRGSNGSNGLIGGMYQWANLASTVAGAPDAAWEGATGARLLWAQARTWNEQLSYQERMAGLVRARRAFASAEQGDLLASTLRTSATAASGLDRLAAETRVMVGSSGASRLAGRAAPGVGVAFGVADALDPGKAKGERMAGGTAALGGTMMMTGIGAPAGAVLVAGATGYQLWRSKEVRGVARRASTAIDRSAHRAVDRTVARIGRAVHR